ncbi:holin family protein, partial [Vibrio parahaemolyticus]|uniref:holin family protein n=1 Tax=Vibrio parahaemolyticus TaxID=670 RepID=UPI001C83B921
YSTTWSRDWRKAFYLFLYFTLAFIALSPAVFPEWFGDQGMLAIVMTLPAFGFYFITKSTPHFRFIGKCGRILVLVDIKCIPNMIKRNFCGIRKVRFEFCVPKSNATIILLYENGKTVRRIVTATYVCITLCIDITLKCNARNRIH